MYYLFLSFSAFKVHLFTQFGCTGSLQLCVVFLQLQPVGAAHWLKCVGFSLQCLLFLFSTSSRACAPQQVQLVALECGLSRCGHGLSCPTVCWILVPGPGIESVSPALGGKFFTTGSPREVPDRKKLLDVTLKTRFIKRKTMIKHLSPKLRMCIQAWHAAVQAVAEQDMTQ